MKPPRIPSDLLPWLEARKRHHLTHAHVQMARELGLNPKKLGGIDNHQQEPWKVPLPQFIEQCYRKRFGIDRPREVLSLEDWAARKQARKEEKREVKRLRLAEQAGQPQQNEPSDNLHPLSLTIHFADTDEAYSGICQPPTHPLHNSPEPIPHARHSK